MISIDRMGPNMNNRLLNLFIGLCLVFTLAGCFGEDYDVGVPTAYLNLDLSSVQLTEANISSFMSTLPIRLWRIIG